MRAFTPEISWHNRLPALSLDISAPINGDNNLYRIATGGNDCRVYIWQIVLGTSSKVPDIRIRAGLRRHQKSVGAVRFSSQQMLASGDDDGYIYLWKHILDHDKQSQTQQEIESNAFLNDDGFEDLELWQQQKVLRGHVEDICDLAWSKDGQFLLSGSVDNSAILWDPLKGVKVWCSDLIKGYVQGVAIDPHNQFMAAISSDRALRIYNFSDKKIVNVTRRMNIQQNKYKAFFCDDTVQTFCRRLEFSPDGQFLIAPTSRMIEKEAKQPTPQSSNTVEVVAVEEDCPQKESTAAEKQNNIVENHYEKVQEPVQSSNNNIDSNNKKKKKPFNVFFIFKRSSFNKPTHYYTTGREIALCARFSPVLYKLRENETNLWGIPYRIVFAVVTSRSVLIYDSQQPSPIGYASQIHLARLTDLAWSSDGRLLMITSYDGYSTLLTFDEGEFGEIYTGPLLEPVMKSSSSAIVEEQEKAVEGDSSINEELNGGVDGEQQQQQQQKQPSKKGRKRMKAPKETVKKEKLETDSKGDSSIEEPPKKTPKKITPIKLPESATMWKYIVKRALD